MPSTKPPGGFASGGKLCKLSGEKMNEGSVKIEGSVENVIYRDDRNGYTVFEILSVSRGEEGNLTVICTAFLPEISIGENMLLTGNFIVHPSYGRQFNAGSAKSSPPTSVSGIVKYLSSSLKGVGERLAIRITDAFGEQTFDVIENFPDKLAAVNGISKKKAFALSEMFKEQSSYRHIMMHLQSYGISPAYIQKIYKKYKEDSVELIRKNPYLLAEDIIGIGFKTADAIAFKAGIDMSSEFRLKAGLKYILRENAQNGHVFLEKGMLLESAASLLGADKDYIDNCITSLQFERQIFQEMQDIGGERAVAVYLNKYFYAESYTAKKLLELSECEADKGDIEAEITEHEKKTGIRLADNQKRAVHEALSSGVLVITGGPGTGKTTVINAVISLMGRRGLSIELAAPTGRAAKRMEEATGMEAKTIHRLLGMAAGEETNRFDKDEDNPIETDVIIIDESSMVDILLIYNLLRAVPHGVRLILVGDADQLPSVGPGNVLNDIIKSGEINVVKLTDIFRQSRESAIVMNAHRINNGEHPLLNEKGRDFFFVRRNTAGEVLTTVMELVRDRLPRYTGTDSMAGIQVLTPMRKSGLGAVSLNQILQKALNPPGGGKHEKEMHGFVFREGDKVMQIKNNYNLAWKVYSKTGQTVDGTGVYNGDEGIIEKIDEDDELLRVRFDGGRFADYDFGRLDELELSYAVTIHKSQGSEYRVVVIPAYSGPPALMTRNLLYTAVTRARELVVIVGLPETLYKMVDNNREVRRFSALHYRLNKIKDLLSSKD